MAVLIREWLFVFGKSQSGLTKPAIRALARAGYLRREQLSKLTEDEVLLLHANPENNLVTRVNGINCIVRFG
ncbi:hypothetical protein GK047_04890 [Paenibacillus sp. SYP-B3998]|uniref:Uncharacterized protein n=1 Tax=Paenibacillus sp. SYP-B3998 TaxID=2678564 RepID=A0A6G3ZT86_9BACL|nr:hypothetical protein [Paenibacillus sp. SYP-B3998]NEW05352.1 hypothetical protein [Paenibacillus sp. SYP-B3998]